MHLLAQSALLKALGWTLVNSLWQMGLLWLTFLLLARVFSKAPSEFRHGLALALLAFGVLGSTIGFIAAYFFGEEGSGVWWTIGPGTWSRLIPNILPYCSTLYLLILASLLTRCSVHYLHSLRLTREGLSKIPAELRVFVESTGRLMGIRPVVRAYLSSLVDVPMTLGFLKPVILLPLAMISQFSTEQVEAILVHELAHIRRKDYLLHLGVTIIGLLFFFNPFTRILIGHLQKEREHCCDDEVLQFRYDPHDYVSALLSLARQQRQGRLALAATGVGGDQLLLQRARRILRHKGAKSRPSIRPFIFSFVTAVVTLLGLSSPTNPVRRHQAEQPQPAVLANHPQPVLFATGKTETVMFPVINTGGPVASAQPASARHQKTRSAEEAKKVQPPIEESDLADARFFGAVANNGLQPGTMRLVLVEPASLTFVAPPLQRDNSLGQPEADADQPEMADPLPPMESLVFVPNSSFSFQQIDTLRPEDKIALLEEATEKLIRMQVERLQKEVQVQLELLRCEEARARVLSTAARQQLKQVLNQQLQLQRDYLRKLDSLQIRLKKTVRHARTVYI